MKMQKLFAASVMSLVLASPLAAQTPPPQPAPAQAPKSLSITTATVADLLGNPAAKAIFEKYFPTVVANPQLSEGMQMTLVDIQQYVPEMTNEKLAAMDTELKALPAK